MSLTKNAIIEIINLCQIMSDGRKNGTITPNTYTQNFKPLLKKIQDKYGESPNLLLQNELKVFYSSHLKNVNSEIKFKNFGFWGRSIYNYTWSCIYYDFGKVAMSASYSPQLYILVNKEGIKFGFCYGHQVENDNETVRSALLPENFNLLKKCLAQDKELYFFNANNGEVTARPENLFDKNDQIYVNTDKDIIDNWSHQSLLIREFRKDEIKNNIGDIILNSLKNLKDFYLSLLPLNEKAENKAVLNLELDQIQFNYKSFHLKTKEAGLKFTEKIVSRFVASLCTKPFVICSGLSGSGKTKLAQSFVKWICKSEEQYKIVPVGADWTNREPLLGYPNGLEPDKYVFPDSGVLQLIINAGKQENKSKPYFVILDEMNLSHVERYFADFLSIMESQDSIKLYSGADRLSLDNLKIDREISWPENLFIIGTVNIDETTYMFSPKVLDRANVIEFRISESEMTEFLADPGYPDMTKFINQAGKHGYGAAMSKDFLDRTKENTISTVLTQSTLVLFFNELKKCGSEFGYRSASEINRLIAVLDTLTKDIMKWDEKDISTDDFIDIAIMQKLLPKLHGSRNRLSKVLPVLGALCLHDSEKIKENYFDIPDTVNFAEDGNIKYKLSFEKIYRMYKNAIENGYASYAEA